MPTKGKHRISLTNAKIFNIRRVTRIAVYFEYFTKNWNTSRGPNAGLIFLPFYLNEENSPLFL
jgi:hypothetical protein